MDAGPDAVFAGTPVTQAVAWFPKNSPVSFIQDPGEALWEKSGWHRWAPPGTPEAAINNLYKIQANRAYILYSTADYTWEVTGVPIFWWRTWQPDSFNFTGFHVDETAPPTFEQFFGGSRAHSPLRVYTLVNNQWLRIADPSAVNIASGRAYWVYCNGGSNHQGPLKITLPGFSGELGFSGPLQEREIEFFNHSPNPISFKVEVLPGSGVPLSLVQKDLTADQVNSYSSLTVYESAPLEPGEKLYLRLAARRKEIVEEAVAGMIKFSDDLGNRFFITVPVDKL